MSASAPLRCLTWNLSGGVLTQHGAPTPLSSDDSVRYIANCIRALNPYLVSLQEVPFFAQEDQFIAEVARAAGFEHFRHTPVSPSHLQDNARLGLAILSRFPLDEVRRVDLPNPGLTIDLPDGRTQRSHDKAMLIAGLKFGGHKMHFVCLHLPPFGLFKRHPGELMFAPLKRVIRDHILPLVGEPLIIAADINTETLYHVIPELKDKPGFFELIYTPTKADGTICDQIGCSRHWTDGRARIIPTWSDHSICVADVSLAEATLASGAPKRQDESVGILHLSDLHFGEGAREDVDWKSWLESAERTTRAARLKQYLKALPRTPDFVVVSGDITIGGKPGGMREFREMVTELIRDEVFPPAQQVVVVPGNHDVTRKVGPRFAVEEERWKTFREELGDKYARPWLPGDPEPEKIEKRFAEFMTDDRDIWGGVVVEHDVRTRESTSTAFPLLFDRKRRVLFYAFNSAGVSGTRIAIDPEVEKNIEALRRVQTQNADLISPIVSELERIREVDPARVNPSEIFLFQSLIAKIRQKSPEEFSRATKIAVLHHHVASIFGEEVKQFELLLNAGQFKKLISAEGFQIVLHGHKHWPEVFVDTAITGGGRLYVISGATVSGAHARLGPGFYYLELQSGERLKATFIELDDQNPRSVIAAAQAKMNVELPLMASDATVRRNAKPAAENLQMLYRLSEQSMLKKLRRQTVQIDGRSYENVGWNHFLGQAEVTPFGTAFGLRVMNLLNPNSFEYRRIRSQVRDTLLRLRRKNGGWSASSLGEPGQPIETAVTLQALSGVLSEADLTECAQKLELMMNDPECGIVRDSTFAVTLIAQVLADTLPECDMTAGLVDTILQGAFRDSQGKYLCWTKRTFFLPDRLTVGEADEPSAAHTALAIIALRSIHRYTDSRLGAKAEDLRAASDWLLQASWEPTVEVIEEYRGKRLAMNVFTLASALRALLMCNVDPNTPRILDAVDELWSGHDNGLWQFGQVKSPVWATLVSLEALTQFYFRRGGA